MASGQTAGSRPDETLIESAIVSERGKACKNTCFLVCALDAGF